MQRHAFDDWSPLRGFASPFGSGDDPLKAYKVGGVSPTVYGDFVGAKNNSVEKYLANGTSTFGNLLTYSGLSTRTMFNSDGNLVWAPHNLCPSSKTLASGWTLQNGTAPSDSIVGPEGDTLTDTLFVPSAAASTNHRFLFGSVTTQSSFALRVVFFFKPQGYTKCAWRNGSAGNFAAFDCTGAGSILDSSLVNASVTLRSDGWYKIVIDQTSASNNGVRQDFYVLDNGYTSGNVSTYSFTGDGVSGGNFADMHSYDDALGGMADVPGKSGEFAKYLTNETTSAKYNPRRNAYEYVSGTLTRRGLQIETDAGVNLIPGRVSDWNGVVTNLTVTANAAESVTGQTDADSLITTDTAGSLHLARHAITKAASATDYVFAWDVEKSDGGAFDFCIILIHGTSSANRAELDLQFSTGTTQTRTVGTGFTVYDSGSIDMGGGRYRAWMSLQSNADTHLQFQAYVAEGFNDRGLDGDGTSGFYVAHCDIKEGRVLSSHIPEGTRAAETIQVNWDSLIGTMPTELTHFLKGSCSYIDGGVTTEVRGVFWSVDGDNFQSLVINTGGALTGRYDFDSEESNNNDQSEVTALQLSPGLGVDFAVTASATASRMMTHLNGTAGNPDTGIAALPALGAEEIRLADFGFVGFLEEYGLYETEISDANQLSITS